MRIHSGSFANCFSQMSFPSNRNLWQRERGMSAQSLISKLVDWLTGVDEASLGCNGVGAIVFLGCGTGACSICCCWG